MIHMQFREANEEVAFPLGSPHVHTLCTLEPFVSPNRVLVTPVIAFLDDVSVLEELRAAPGEVARIFDHPLEALLDPELLRDLEEEKLVPLGSEDWPYETELHVSSIYPLAYFFSFLFLFFSFGNSSAPFMVSVLNDFGNRISRMSLGWALCIACIVFGAPPRL